MYIIRMKRIGEFVMKKFVYTVALGLVLVSSFTACSKNEGDGSKKVTETAETTEDADTDVDALTVAEKLLEEGDFKDNLAAVDKGIAMTRLYGLDESIVEDAAFYTNSNATAEEIAVIKVADSTSLEQVKKAYEARVESQKDACRDYLPEEMPKLESAVICEYGNYVILCVSDDNDRIEGIIKEIME